MRWTIAIVAVCLMVASGARAQDDTRRAQVAAATANAVAALREDISTAYLARNLTVGEFLKQTDGTDYLTKTLERSEQIGGPRWIDDQICQVQLEIAGPRVVSALSNIAAANPRKSPLTPELIQAKLSDWQTRTFSATGSSVAAARLQSLRPLPGENAWANVSEEARRQAATAAGQDAVNRVLTSIAPIELAPGSTLGDALKNPTVQRIMSDWLSTRPVRRVDYRDDQQVEITLAVPPVELADTLRVAIVSVPSLPQPRDAAAWSAIRDDIARRMVAPVGRASVSPAGVSAPHTRAAISIPRQPPAWADRQIDTDGVAAGAATRLKCARLAEASALQKLRAMIEDLPLAQSLTLGAAAQQDPRIHDALNRAMARARTYKADYLADGSVTVRVSLDLRDLWSELQTLP